MDKGIYYYGGIITPIHINVKFMTWNEAKISISKLLEGYDCPDDFKLKKDGLEHLCDGSTFIQWNFITKNKITIMTGVCDEYWDEFVWLINQPIFLDKFQDIEICFTD